MPAGKQLRLQLSSLPSHRGNLPERSVRVRLCSLTARPAHRRGNATKALTLALPMQRLVYDAVLFAAKGGRRLMRVTACIKVIGLLSVAAFSQVSTVPPAFELADVHSSAHVWNPT